MQPNGLKSVDLKYHIYFLIVDQQITPQAIQSCFIPVSELCERTTFCKWIYSCKQVMSVSPHPWGEENTQVKHKKL